MPKAAVEPLRTLLLRVLYLSFGLNNNAAISPKKTEAVIPAAEAQSPPESAPISPSSATAERTPFAIRWPKPERGTVAPAPAKSTMG